MLSDPIIIIGAGIGGLAAAIRLAAAGEKVVVLEQNPTVGGKMGQLEAEGFRWDTGPSVITMRPVLEDLFATAGRQLDDYLTLLPVEPLTRYFYPDGTVLDVTRNLPEMRAQIAALNKRDGEGYLAYLAYAARLHRITGPVFIYNQPPTWRSFFKVSPFDVLKVDGLRTMAQSIGRFVRSPHLRQLLGRFATYVGASPYLVPATLNVIAHVELTGGVWYPQGGIYAIARALAALAGELGVDIRTHCPVAHIDITNGAASGVTLSGGPKMAAKAVVANVDVAMVYQKLLPEKVVSPNRLKKLIVVAPSCSGFILLLGVDKIHPHLAHHNIFFSSNYPREFDEIFQEGIPPTEPTVYVAITSKTDAGHAPTGSENWFVLVNAPPLGPHFNWDTQAENYRNVVLDYLAGGFGLELRPHIRVEKILTPVDIARLTGARRGALYGASSNNRFNAFRRPHNRAPDVSKLYFVGGTTHPGGGVPMVMLSGKVGAGLVLEDLA